MPAPRFFCGSTSSTFLAAACFFLDLLEDWLSSASPRAMVAAAGPLAPSALSPHQGRLCSYQTWPAPLSAANLVYNAVCVLVLLVGPAGFASALPGLSCCDPTVSIQRRPSALPHILQCFHCDWFLPQSHSTQFQSLAFPQLRWPGACSMKAMRPDHDGNEASVLFC